MMTFTRISSSGKSAEPVRGFADTLVRAAIEETYGKALMKLGRTAGGLHEMGYVKHFAVGESDTVP